MFMKICTYCKRPSYNACAEKGNWICPHCDMDITNVPASADLGKTMSEPRLSSDSHKTDKE